MPEGLAPDPKLLLFLLDLLNRRHKHPLDLQPESQELLRRVVHILGGNLLQLGPLDLGALLVEEVALLFCLVAFFADHAEFLAFWVDADGETRVAVDAAGGGDCGGGRGHVWI